MILLRTLLNNNKNCGWSLISSYNRASSTLAPENIKKSSDHYEKYSLSPGEVYDKKVEFEEVSDDKSQRLVIDAFDHLSERLVGYKPPAVKKSNVFSQLFFGGSVEEKRTAGIPRGVYLWGTVGGGM
jgi:predicted ATPase